MGVSCWVKGCHNRADNSVRRGFYSIPSVRENKGDFTKTLSNDRRRLWLANINRKDAPTKYSKICSDHFINGKPSSMYERSNPDLAPTLLLGENLTPSKSLKKEKKIETNTKRYQRKLDRGEVREKHHVARALLELQSESPESHEIFTAVPLAPESPSKPPDHSQESELLESPSTPQVTQSQVDSEIQRLISENMQLKAELQAHQLSKESFEHDGEKVEYYTGLSNYSVLLIVLNIVTPFIGTKNIGLGIFERLLMTLMRLKLNMPVQDLAYRFGVSTSTVSRIFLVMIHILYIRLKHLIFWPEREELQKTMPMEFRTHFSKKTFTRD